MKAPLEWLKDFTDIPVETHEFCEKMTLSGSKVEGIITSGKDIQNVFTGRIVSFVPHQDSDHLVICQVDMGSRELGDILQIVCGAPNVVAGMICPVAVEGAMLPGGLLIKKGKLRGVESQGMCCSVQELGFTASDLPGGVDNGLWHMPDDTPIGMDIKVYLGLGYTTVDFEITSNRPDCFSMEGLGREAAITLEQTFTPRKPFVKELGSGKADQMARVDILAPDLCYRYCARVVEDVHIGPSPSWMQRRLRDAGMRPINNIVDITNYVCLELGQPMHAFDLEYLSGHHIVVRKATDREKTKTLDGVERVLDSNMLVIADDDKVCAIAGVMGSENSEVKPSTRTVLFESATFDAVSVRHTAVRNGLRTEASSRYEKGLDSENALRALSRACELVELIHCGSVARGVIDVYPTRRTPSEIVMSADKINKLLGTQIDESYMRDILMQLGCKLSGAEEAILCTPPTFRQDILGLADIAEEIARFHGYNNIEPTLLSGKETTLGGRTHAQIVVEKVKDVMIAQGYFEAITYSFESAKDNDRIMLSQNDPLRRQIVIKNPLGEEYTVMRTSMIPSMLRIAATNSSRSVASASIFEIAYVYLPHADPSMLPEEKRMLSAFSYDTKTESGSADLFFSIKGVVTELCANLGIASLSFEPVSDITYLHPGRSARVLIQGKTCGYIGYVHPEVADNFEAPDTTALLVLEMDAVIQASTQKRPYTPLPKFPGISRDIAVTIDAGVPVGFIEKIIRKQGGKYLESFLLFDVYTGKQIGESKKSVAYSLQFRSVERTLTEADILDAYNNIIASLEKEIGAQLR
jgi:phenylalanyl-tRNA synthetase beta chain